MSKIYIVGLGPGDTKFMTPQAAEAIAKSDVVAGYTYYLELIADSIVGKQLLSSGMKRERERALMAFEAAASGKTVAMVSSGDAGIYGMASLLWELKMTEGFNVELEVVPGISALIAAAAKLGAPLGHDFCTISMSDLLTDWEVIEKRISAAASADFVTAIYNPVSNDRFWQLMRLKEIFLSFKSPQTPVGIARQVGRADESLMVTTLGELEASMADMFTVILIGNRETVEFNGKMITPRGYRKKLAVKSEKPGRVIMNQSFRTILDEIDGSNYSLQQLWVALHCIHTTADTSIIDSIELTDGVMERLHRAFYSGEPPVIITDVRMVTNGIRKAVVNDLGLTIKCYLDDPRTDALAVSKNITRTQAGIRLAADDYPNAIFAFGNAPTALMELVKLIRLGKANPSGVIAAPVGFINVEESKWRLKYGCTQIPAITVMGRKGGSNVAATIINAILSWDDAKEMHPGKGL